MSRDLANHFVHAALAAVAASYGLGIFTGIVIAVVF